MTSKSHSTVYLSFHSNIARVRSFFFKIIIKKSSTLYIITNLSTSLNKDNILNTFGDFLKKILPIVQV
jgi:hypothetical protein